MAVVADYQKIDLDKELLIEAIKGGTLGAGTVFATDFLLSKFLHNSKIRAAICATAPIALAMWLKEKNPELATGLAIGGAGAGIYKLIQAFLYEKLHIPYAGYDEYGIIEEVPIEETPTMEVVEAPETTIPKSGYGRIVEVPEEATEEIVVEQPTYGTSLA